MDREASPGPVLRLCSDYRGLKHLVFQGDLLGFISRVSKASCFFSVIETFITNQIQMYIFLTCSNIFELILN